MAEAISFRSEPVDIKIGAKQTKVIKISDVPYPIHQKVLKMMGELFVEREALPQAIKRIEQHIQQIMLKDGKSADDAGKIFSEMISGLYMHINDKRIIEMLKLLSSEQITDEDIADMGASEVMGLLAWLLERNFKSLKNLYASLDSIQNPSQTNQTK